MRAALPLLSLSLLLPAGVANEWSGNPAPLRLPNWRFHEWVMDIDRRYRQLLSLDHFVEWGRVTHTAGNTHRSQSCPSAPPPLRPSAPPPHRPSVPFPIRSPAVSAPSIPPLNQPCWLHLQNNPQLLPPPPTNRWQQAFHGQSARKRAQTAFGGRGFANIPRRRAWHLGRPFGYN